MTDRPLDTIAIFAYAFNMSRAETRHCLEEGGLYINNIRITENENPFVVTDETNQQFTLKQC